MCCRKDVPRKRSSVARFAFKYSIDNKIDIPIKSEKKLSKRVSKLNSGIEVSMPAELLRDDNKVEFINNDDRTSVINIKGIDSIKTRIIN